MKIRTAVLIAVVILFARGWRIHLKNGVVLVLTPELARALPLIYAAHADIGIREPIFTSGAEGEHMPGSLHYAGLAVDIRSRDLSSFQVVQLINALRRRLSEDWQVIDESDHIHLEFDP